MTTAFPARGRLIFNSGAANLTISGSTSIETLYQAEFEGAQPEITEHDGMVTIKYPRFSLFDWLKRGFNADHMSGHITLNARVPWEIDFNGGVAQFTGDLRTLRVSSLRLNGGASGITLQLGTPEGTVPVRITGGMSSLSVERPASVPTSLRMMGGATGVRFDDQSFGAMGGQMTMRSQGEGSAHGSYEIEVTGGATSIAVVPAEG